MSQNSHNHSLLGNVLGSIGSGTLFDGDHRRYVSYFLSQAVIGGVSSSLSKAIRYEIGFGEASCPASFPAFIQSRIHSSPSVDASYKINTSAVDFFADCADRYSKAYGNFHRASLAPLVHSIGIALALVSAFGTTSNDEKKFEPLDSSVLLAGKKSTEIIYLTATLPPNTYITNCVFIPHASSNFRCDVWAVLVAAAGGLGAQVVTDFSVPIVPIVEPEYFPDACVSALHILGSNMVQAGQGPLFAITLTKAFHSVLKVRAHTEEGGCFRSLLTPGSFGVPFGGINFSAPKMHYCGLPALRSSDPSDIAAFVDSITLVTAAAVAVSDPGSHANGVWFPTVVVSAGEFSPGACRQSDGTDQDGKHNLATTLKYTPRFFDLWVPTIAKIFGTNGDMLHPTLLLSSTSLFADSHSRSWMKTSLAPFFWIEPTSLLPMNFAETVAEQNGCGPLCSPDERATFRSFPGLSPVGKPQLSSGYYSFEIASARRFPLYQHFRSTRSKAVLDNIVPRQMDPIQIGFPGCTGRYSDCVYIRLMNQCPLPHFMWDQGASAISPPSEFLNTHPRLIARIVSNTPSDDLTYSETGLPQPHELASHSCTFSVFRPMAIDAAKYSYRPSEVARSRCHALLSLSPSAARYRRFGSVEIGDVPVSCTLPRAPGTIPECDHPHCLCHLKGE